MKEHDTMVLSKNDMQTTRPVNPAKEKINEKRY